AANAAARGGDVAGRGRRRAGFASCHHGNAAAGPSPSRHHRDIFPPAGHSPRPFTAADAKNPLSRREGLEASGAADPGRTRAVAAGPDAAGELEGTVRAAGGCPAVEETAAAAEGPAFLACAGGA